MSCHIPIANEGKGYRYEIRYDKAEQYGGDRLMGTAAKLETAEKMAAAWRLAPGVVRVWIVDTEKQGATE